jgi:hypothetical protein
MIDEKDKLEVVFQELADTCEKIVIQSEKTDEALTELIDVLHGPKESHDRFVVYTVMGKQYKSGPFFNAFDSESTYHDIRGYEGVENVKICFRHELSGNEQSV